MTNPPLPKDVQDFQFKLASKLKVYERKEDCCSGPVNLLAVSSKLGLVFVAGAVHLQIFETSALLQNHGGKGGGADVDIFPRYCMTLPSRPSHIGISCDHLHLAVILAPADTNQYPTALIYAISSLILKNTIPSWEIRLGTVPGVAVQDIAWNPRIPQLFCVCLSDGSVFVNELKGSSQIFDSISLPSATGARCISWSPKGKQLVIGTAHGPVIQCKPDLKQVKVISPPQPTGFVPISLLWLSSFQFAVVFGSSSGNGNGAPRPGLYIVNTPKGESDTHLNYDDICYSSGDLRQPQYYLSHIPRWNVLLMSSANSMEVGVLASDGSSESDPKQFIMWEQWTLEDASRAELPLSPSREEMYPVGMAVDTSPTAHLPWGENQSIPPAPLLLILSNHGLLCTFNIINLRPGAAHDLCLPPEVIPGIREMLLPLGPPSLMLTMVPPSLLPSFGAQPPQSQVAAFPATSNAFLQGPPPSFSAATSIPSFAPLPSPALPSSLFGSQSVKADAGKGWLAGTPGGTSFGFGALGTAATPTKEVPLSIPSSVPGFQFNVSSASANFPLAAAPTMAQVTAPPPPPTVHPQPQQPQMPAPNFSFTSQQPPLPLSAHEPAHVVPTQRTIQEGAPFVGAVIPSPIGPSKSVVTERIKPAIAPLDSVQVPIKTPVTSMQPPPATAAATVPVIMPAVSNAAIFNAIIQETALFEKELMQLKMRHQKFNVVMGTSDEKRTLRVKVDAMETFLGELSEVTQVHTTTEIHALRTLLMEAFAWVEEARSRHLYSKNPRYLHLAMVQELDPVIKKHTVAIRNRIHYLDTQLQQMDSSLDNQWATFQDNCNKKKRKQQKWGSMDSTQIDKRDIHMPSLEFVYQTILSQQQIIEKHKARLDELEMKVRTKANWDLNGNSFASLAGFQTQGKRGPSTTHERSAIGEQDLSSMAESLLAMQLGESKSEGRVLQQIGSKNPLVPKKMLPRHLSQLCNLLAHKPMTRVIPSPRGMSSINVLPMPSKVMDSKTSTPKKDDPPTEVVPMLTASPSGKTLKATSTPVKKEVVSFKVSVAAANFPVAQAPIAALKGSPVQPPSFVTQSSSYPLAVGSVSGEIGSTSLDAMSRQSKLLVASSEPSESSNSAVTGFPMSPVSATSTASNVKGSLIPTKTVFVKGFSGATTSILPLSSPTTISATKSISSQPSSIFSGTGLSAVSAPPSESSTWSFSTSGSFSIGSSSKSGGISSGKPVVSPVAPSLLAPAAPTPLSTAPAFTLNYSANSKQSFSLTPKPATQPTFTLPLPVFGAQGGSVSVSSSSPSSSKEPLFVFGGSSIGSAVNVPASKPVVEESAASIKNENVEKEKENEQKLEESKPEKVSGGGVVELIKDSKEKAKEVLPEKLPTTFLFCSSFGQTVAPLGNTTVAETGLVSATTTSAPPAALVQSPTREETVPEKKVDSNTVKEKPEEKSSASRSLFTDFSFKLSEGESESFGAKPLMFGGSSSPSPSPNAPASTSIFKTPTSSAPPPQLSATVTPTEALSASLPIISQPEPTTTTISSTNPLSSLGSIVANLGSGGNTFGKPASEAPKPVETSTFSTFSFALPTKDSVAKPLPTETPVELPPGDGPKTTPIKGLSPVSPPGVTPPNSQAPVAATSSSSTTSDFGQGLANILGQSLPISSPSPTQQQQQQQQQPIQNPFATGGSGSVFGSSSGSSPSTTVLFGKPAEGSPAVNLFGQPLKQDAAPTSFFGSSPTATPPATSVPSFGSSSVFGQPTSSSAPVFGGSGGFGSKPVFGQNMSGGTAFSLGGSVFGQSAGSSSTTSIFGSPSASATSGGNLFQTPATSSSGTFGSSGGSIFGSVAQAGFGSPTSSFQAKPGGFGGSPVFGAMASGGSSPSFGGAATFGSPPAFGGHVFGASVSTAGNANVFGSGGAATPSTFENLATSPSILTFGNLAQGSGSPFGASQPQAPPAFGSGGNSASAGGASSSFGGSSFTSWR